MAVPAQRVAAAQTIDLPGVPLRLGEGIELLGQYQGSGFKEAPYLVRRPDGQMIQLPPLLYFVAERLDGDRDLDEIADEVTAVFGRGIDADGVKYLIDVYCGVGFFALETANLIERFVGVELDRPAIQAARQNARNRSIHNGEFVDGRAEDGLPRLLEQFPSAHGKPPAPRTRHSVPTGRRAVRGRPRRTAPSARAGQQRTQGFLGGNRRACQQ